MLTLIGVCVTINFAYGCFKLGELLSELYDQQ